MTNNSTNKRAIWSWAMFDFANQPFTTLVLTFIYGTFFTQVIAPDEITGTALWTRGITITAIVVALCSPILGAAADRGGFRKRFLLMATATCIGGTLMLYGVLPGEVTQALFWFVLANIAFEMGMVFYNAFLPDVAPEGQIGRVSGYGWGLGYVGGLLALAVALFTLVHPETPWFGVTREDSQNIRATNILVAIWFAVFSLPMFLWVKEDKSAVSPEGFSFQNTFGELAETFHEIRTYRQVVRFLLARLFFNDGLVTIFALGGIYAAGTFGFPIEKVLMLGIVLSLTAGIGAFLMGHLDDRLGGKRTIAISLGGLSLGTLIAILSPNELGFWVGASMIGAFSGPNQSASRSLMGRFVPPDKENEFFGFFAFSGKATAFLGPLLFGVMTQAFDSQRAGVAVVLVLFAIGWWVLRGVDEAEGIEAAGR